MSNKMLVSVKLDQRLSMSQQLRQAITLLQYNTLDLKQLVKQQLETNPLLEADESEIETSVDEEQSYLSASESTEDSAQFLKYSASLSKQNKYHIDESTLENCAIPKSLREYLLDQTLLCHFDKKEEMIAEAIIDAVDENGYLTMTLEDIQHVLGAHNFPDLGLLESVLKRVQTFDPIGVASRGIQECLLIQLECLSEKNEAWEIAYKIIKDNFENIATSHVKKVIKQLDLSQDEFAEAMTIIRTLNPHPGQGYASDLELNIEPELYVKKIKGKWQVFLAESILTHLKINNQYQELIKQNKKHDSYEALKQELEEARGLLKGLRHRNETLLMVASHIMEMQKDFLEHGKSHMKAMNIADVAQALEVHESTISRVTTGKYIATPQGVFELKYFFPSYVMTDSGETCSDTAVKTHIKEIIHKETIHHIYSDNEIAEMLQKKLGVNIARRTVAKYREALKIMSSYQRLRVKQSQPCEVELE